MLSIDLKVSRGGCVLVCRGDLLGGKEAEYLFNLITGEDKGDVILELGGANKVDDEGVSVIISAYGILEKLSRKLLLKNLQSQAGPTGACVGRRPAEPDRVRISAVTI
jgi:hypothetical protein